MCILNNEKCEIPPTFINLNPNEYSQEFHYYPFTVKLGKCVGSCNTLNGLPNKVSVPNKTEVLYLGVFKIIIGINEPKKLKRHASVSVNLIKENVIHISRTVTIIVDVSVKNVYVNKVIFGILVPVFVKMENI